MGNISEGNRDDVDVKKFLEQNPIYRPPRKGETNILNMPSDCLGVIVEYLDQFSSIRALMISCREFYRYFNNQKAMERVSFSLNFAIKLKKKIDFIYRLRCQTYFYQKVLNHHFSFFPNLKFLFIEYTEQINSEIFPLLPNLVEIVVRGGEFSFIVGSESRGMYHLSENIRTISIRNRSCGRRSSQHNYKFSRHDGSINLETLPKDEGQSFFRDVLLHRPFLVELEFSRLKFLKIDYEFFFQLSQRLKNLRKLSLRYCRVIEYNKISLPSSLEELDLCGCYMENFNEEAKNLSDEDEESLLRKKERKNIRNLPLGLKKLNLSDQRGSMLNEQIRCLFEDVKEVYTHLTHLEISENDKVNDTVFERIAKIFPNLEYIRAVDTNIRNEGINVLIKQMKCLKTVRISKNSIRTSGMLNTYDVIQKFGNVSFVVL